jgi:hypothetical protein
MYEEENRFPAEHLPATPAVTGSRGIRVFIFPIVFSTINKRRC